VTRRPVRELVDSVGSADFEPIVAKIIRHERIANSHECLLYARFHVEILRDLNLVVACPALLGHLPVITLLVVPALHAQFASIAGVCVAKNSGFDIVLDRCRQDFVVALIPDTHHSLRLLSRVLRPVGRNCRDDLFRILRAFHL